MKELDASGSFFIATCEIRYDIIITEKNTIFKDLYEYFRSELPLCVNLIYVALCLILMFIILGTDRLDKYLNSKGVENFGNFLTVSSILIFVLENSIIEMDAVEAIVILLICATIVIGAVWLLFSKYEK